MNARALVHAAAAFLFGLGAPPALGLVSLDPLGFPPGTDVSTMFDAVELSTVDAMADASHVTLIAPLRQTSTSESPIYAASNTFSRLTFPASWSAGPCCLLFKAMRIDFLDLATEVTVQFLADDSDTGLLAVFGPNGEVLADLIGEGRSPFDLSYTSAGTPIAYALASFADTGYIGRIQYEPVEQVPEPTTFALLGLGIVGLALSRRKQ